MTCLWRGLSFMAHKMGVNALPLVLGEWTARFRVVRAQRLGDVGKYWVLNQCKVSVVTLSVCRWLEADTVPQWKDVSLRF